MSEIPKMRNLNTLYLSHFLSVFEMKIPESNSFNKVGDLPWHQCELSTPSEIVRFSGFDLFNNCCLSATSGEIEDGNFERTAELWRRAVSVFGVSPLRMWQALSSLYQSKGKYTEASRTIEMAVQMFPQEPQLWYDLLCAFFKEVHWCHVVIERCKRVMPPNNWACQFALGKLILWRAT